VNVAIDVSVTPEVSGGIASALRSLVSALGALSDGPEEYTIVVGTREQLDWLSPLGPNQRCVMRPSSRKHRILRPVLPAVRRLQNWLGSPRHWPEVPLSDGFFESLGCDVIHFPTQTFTLCALPSVYNPHDLQHLHYPQFFNASELAWRETVYRAGCHFAQTVIVNSQWVKEDITRQYAVPPTKVQVIPEAPSTQSDPLPSTDDIARFMAKYRLQDGFALYPSVSWPHKNHLRLLDALAYLRDRRGLRVPLVCTGAPDSQFFPRIESRIADLFLTDQVRFLGFVPQPDLRTVYRCARLLVLPTLFEANSLPIFEAWLEGTPVACSNVTALPEQVMDAALLFDPFDHEAIANAVSQLFTDDQLRDRMRERGHSRLKDFDWARTAKAYRAVYRRCAGQQLSEEDCSLLAWDWMREPGRSLEVVG